METADNLKTRIKEASRFMPLDRLALSPQCGFASTQEGNRISPDIQRQKLELVGHVAHDVWS
jgi:5-methyltetrahydropteroyltriglutamate--homocysteine methyltransferase